MHIPLTPSLIWVLQLKRRASRTLFRANPDAFISSFLVLSLLVQCFTPFLGVTQAQTLLLRPVAKRAVDSSNQPTRIEKETAGTAVANWLEPLPPPTPTTIIDTVVSRHSPTLNSGRIEGSLRVLLGESFSINGNTQLTSDLYLPGTPTIQLSGGAQHGGILDDGGSSTPTNYTLSLGGSVNLPGKIHTRVDAIPLTPAFPVAVPLTLGTRTVTVNSQSGVAAIGDWQTVRDLNVKGANITIDVPPGNYRTITVNGNSRINFTSGTYNFSNTLSLDGSALLQTTGSVTINIARNLQINSGAVMLGRYTSPGNLQLNVLGSVVDINGSSQVSGLLRADNATVTLNGKATLQGQVIGNIVVLNGGNVIGAVWPALNGVCPTVFGPRRYVRSSGNPNLYVEQFSLPAGLTSPFTLHIQNGASDGTQRISSASLKINGVDLLASNDLNQNVASLDRTLTLGLNNQLDMEIQGSSGYLTLNFCGTMPAGDTTAPTITISSPANNSSTTATQITVTGSATDSGSGIAHVYVNNSEASYNSTDSSWTISNVPLVLGENQITVRAVDQSGNESTRVILITRESPANHAPTADAGSDQTLTVGQNASLQGVATDDGLPSGSTLSSTWSQVSGPGTVSFVNANALATTASFSLPGTYVLRLTVTDGALSAIDDVTVIIQPTNQPPTVIAGADQTIALPLSATLEGMVTDDGLPAQSTVGSEWTKVSGPGTVSFGDSSEPHTTASFSLPGTYVLRLTASDSELFTHADVTIVAYQQNQAPTVSAGPDQTISLPNGAQLNGSASDDFAPAGSNLTTTWSKVSGPAAVTFDSVNSAVTVARFTVAGTYVLRLSASDGDLSTTDDITITVTPPNQAPTVNAGVDQIISLPTDTVNLNGSVTDDQLPTGSSVIVSWNKVSGPGAVTFGNATSLATTAQFSVDGDYVLRLTATDGDLSSSDDVFVKVTQANQAPSTEAGPNQTITLPAAANLNGSVSDDGLPLNSTLTTTWSKLSGPGTVTFGNPNVTVTTVAFSEAGTYVLRLTASDSQLSTNSDVEVVVIPENCPPIANAGADQTVTLPASANLSGSTSDDGLPTGSTVTTVWSLVSGPGAVTFVNANALVTTASFGATGTYVLRLTSSDTQLTASDELTVTVLPQPVIGVADNYSLDTEAVAGLSVPVTFRVRTFLEGPPFANLSSLACSQDGKLYAINVSTTQLYEIDLATRNISTLVNSSLSSPGKMLIGDGRPLTGNDLIIADNNTEQSSGCCDGRVYRISRTSGAISVLSNGNPTFNPPGDPYGLALGPGGGFGNGLYVMDFEGNSPNPPVLFRINADGTRSTFLTSPSVWTTSRYPTDIAFSPGPDFGDYLYALDGSQPGGDPVIWRINSQAELSKFAFGAPFLNPVAIEFGNGGVFGRDLYLLDRGKGVVYRIMPDGTISTFVSGLPTSTFALGSDIAFSPDGRSLFIALDDKIYEVTARSLTVPAPGLLLNDSGVAGVPLTASLFNAPTQGTLVFNADGSFTYQTNESFAGSDTFTYKAVQGSQQSNVTSVTITGTVSNLAPNINAGTDQTIFASAGDTIIPPASLMGAVADDGRPAGSTLSITWSKVSGPGTVGFANATQAVTTASFGAIGNYVLRLTASDSAKTISDDVAITVVTSNQAPTVNAGSDKTFTASARQVLFFDDFESGGGKWMDPGSMIISTTSALSGTHSQTFGRVWGAGDARSTFIPVNPGQTYFLRGAYMTLGGGGFFGVENFNASQQYISHTWFFGDGSDFAYNTWPYYNINNTPASELGRWRVYEHAYVVPAGVRYLRIITEDWSGGLPNDPLNHGVFYDNIELSTYASPQTTLTGSVSDDGLPQGSTVTVAWTMVSGPGTVIFSSPNQLGTNATFGAPGTYVLRLSASDSALNGSDDVTVTVLPANQRPDANAGPDQTTTMANNPLSLNGTAIDDGLPSGVPLVTAWSVVNSKSLATFAPLVDDFNDNSFDALKWGGVELTGIGTNLFERNQRIEFVPGSGSSTGLFRSNGYADVRGRTISFKFNGYNSTSQTSRFRVRDDGAWTTFWANFNNGAINFFSDSYFDSTTRTDGQYPYNGSAPIWLRYRQAGNQFFWDTSSDGNNWTNRLTLNLFRPATATQFVRFDFSSSANLPPISIDDFQSNCVTLSQLTGPGTVSFSNPNTPATTATFSDAGIFLLRLMASDSELSDLSDALITVHPANQAPTISVNTNQSVTLPFLLGLNASVYDDGYPVGSTLTQTWTKQSGPGTVTFANATSPMTTASFSASGLYVLRLTVSDSALTSFVDVTVNVYPLNTACPNDYLSDNFNDNSLDLGKWTGGSPGSTIGVFERSQQLELVLQPNTVDYNAVSSASTFDLRGKRVQVEVKQASSQAGYTETYITAMLDGANYYLMDAGSGSLVMDSYTAGVRNRTILTYVAATHRFWRIRHDPPTTTINFETSSDGLTWTTRKTVQETFPLNSIRMQLAAGAWGTGNSTPGKAVFDNVRVMSLYPDCPPSVTLTSPAPNATFAASSNITLTATASPSLSEGTVSKVEFFSNGIKLGEAATSPYTFVWNNVSSGSYSLTAKVTDDRGATATSPAVPITVFTPNQAPNVNAGVDQTITLPNVATLQGSANDDGLPSGTLSTTWSKISGPGNVSFANANSLSTSATFTTTGVYVLRLTANDSTLSASDDVQITVNPNVAPTANAGPDQTVTIFGNQVLNAGNDQSLVNNEISNWTEVQGTNWTIGNVNSGAGFPEAQYGSNYFFAGDAPQAELRQDIDLSAYAANIAAGTQQFELKAYVRSANETVPDAARIVIEYRNATNTSVIATLDSGPITTTSGWHLTEDTRAAPAGTGWMRLRLLATRNTGATNDAFFDSISLRPVGNAAVKLNGVATDEGLPTGSAVTATWTKVSGPSGVTFANASSAATTATFTIAGTYVLRLTANDGQLTTDDDVTVVVNPANQLPSVNAGTNQTITLPANANLSGTATDDGQPLGSSVSVTWSKAAGPGTVSFSNSNGVSTTATFSTAGVYILRLTADDSEYANSADVTVTVNPAPPNQPPTVNAGPDQTISLPIDTANLNGSASDDGLPAGSSLTVSWTKISGPGVVTFGDVLAAITTAQFSATGTYVLRLSASDGDLSPTDDVTITVTPPNQSPTASAGADQSILLSQQAILNGSASDDGLPYGSSLATTWTKVSGPGTVTFGNPNVTVTTAQFSVTGDYVLRLTSNDGDLSAHDDLTVSVNDHVAPPTVEITNPIDGSELTAPTSINGTVSNGEWVLEYSLNTNDGANNQIWTQVGSGNGPLSNSPLSTLDTTLMLNGIYSLRLKATDQYGQTSFTSISVLVDKNFKVGQLQLAFSDLNVPVAGLPIEVIRSYDSRDKRVGDFGVGWQLGIRSARVEKTGILGLGWTETVTSGFIPTYCLEPTRPHKVAVTFGDGKVFKFLASTANHCQQAAPISSTHLTFTPEPGTHASLEVVGTNDILVAVQGSLPGPVQLLNQSNPDIFNTGTFRLTTDEGVSYVINQLTGVSSVRDPYGNTLTITASGITHSSGQSVSFTRDNLGRITQITDPNGNPQTYTYDANGDLVTFTDRENHTTTFTYNSDHHLMTIVDARGINLLTNQYDTSGRLIGQTDAFNKSLIYDHNVAGRVETITDRLGHDTRYEYDERGNVLRQVDAKNGVKTFTYDDFDNVLTETNQLNKTTTYTYDAADNRTSVTDPLNNVTQFTYNGARQVLTITDARNKVTTNTYDAAGTNLLTTTDPLNNTTTFTYNLFTGQRTTMKDALNHVTQYGYDGNGRLTTETDALNNVTSYGYDTYGNRTSQTVTRTNAQGQTENITTTFTYDKLNRLTKTTFVDGSFTRVEYNEIGQQSATVDQLTHRTEFTYDEMGRLKRTDYADGTHDETTYDEEGRRLTSKDRSGRTTSFEYDELGRLTKTTYPDNTFTSTTYDAAGQVLTSTDARGKVTRFEYDDAGRRTKVKNALNQETTFTYDPNGNQLTMTDALSHTTTFEYDANSRRTKTIYEDSTFDLAGYDELGRNVSKTDQAGKTTQFIYDELGRLKKVKDALNQETNYTYNELGQQLTQTDANNHTTHYEYDQLGRRVKRILPAGQFETYSYETGGNLQSRTDFNGKTTTFTYDVMRRLLTKVPDASLNQPTITFTYKPSGQRATMNDASGETVYTYDVRNRLSSKQTPFGTLNYTYDDAGNLLTTRSSNANGVSVDYSYDDLNRLSTVKDNRLVALNGGITSYGYDPVGNLDNYLYPNGVTTSYHYNSLNRLTSMNLGVGATALSSYTYTLGAAGNRTAVAELGGRTVNYTYDDLYRLTNETITNDPHSVNGAVGYGYDPVGNRLSRTSTLAGVPAQTSTYDANDRLTSDSYDNNGNTTSSNSNGYAYDFENHLTSLNNGAVTYLYDGDGNRVAKSVGGVTTNYLVDTNNPTGYAQVVDELQSGTVTKSFTYGHDLISQRIIGGPLSFYGYDGHGSVRQLTDATAAITDTYDYDAFGNLISHTGTTPNDYLYSGEQFDASLGFYYLRARYMNSVTGIFGTFDTYEGQPNDPSTLHKFLYAGANPINQTDPTGHFFSMADVMAAGIIRVGLAGITSLQGHAMMDQLIHGGNAGLKSLVANGLFMMSLGLLPFARIPGKLGSSSSRGLSASADALEGALFRGTSEGFAGGPTAIAHGLTSTTTNPAIAHMFAAESATHGSRGLVYIARESDLAGIELAPGNVLSSIENEIVLKLQPAEFASRASIKLTTEQSQMILRERGIDVPSRIYDRGELSRFVREAPIMTPLDITLYLRRALEISQ